MDSVKSTVCPSFSSLRLEDTGVHLEWDCTLLTSAANEKALVKALKEFTHPREMWKLAHELPASTVARIGATATDFGFTDVQAFSLRRGLLKCVMGMKPFMALDGNDDKVAKAIADAFEECVEAYLRARLPDTITITTEAERKTAAKDSGVPMPPTPDFTFQPPICINGHDVAWIDAKMLYASLTLIKKNFMPESRLAATAEKYNKLFGRGAFVFGNGACYELGSFVPALMLDSSPLDMGRLRSVIESSQQRFPTTVDLDAIAQETAAKPVVTSGAIGAGRPHVWDSRIRIGHIGTSTYHYHVCTRCGAEGVKRKYSRRKSVICPPTLECATS